MNIQVKDFNKDEIIELPHEVDFTENHYFPTQVFSAMLPDERAKMVNKQLVNAIQDERKRDKKGIQRSNFRALGGWHSKNHLYKQKEYQGLIEIIDSCCRSIEEKNGYHKDHKLKVTTMWSIANPPGSSNRAHIHPGCAWSGVYYVQTPENSGNIEFIDPRTQNMIAPPQYMPNKARKKTCWTKVNHTPKAGKLLIFPSWLYHSVAPNLSEKEGLAGERIIISFNISQVKKVRS